MNDEDAIAALLMEIKALSVENARLRAALKDMQQELRDVQAGASSEAHWQERQGEEYGSY